MIFSKRVPNKNSFNVLTVGAVCAIYVRACISQNNNRQHAGTVSTISARPVIMPFLFFGPSNQIHQAKEAVYAMHGDNSESTVKDKEAFAFTLMLPHLLPHYSQSGVDGVVAFSEYFDIESDCARILPSYRFAEV